jgi:hypothetical protein
VVIGRVIVGRLRCNVLACEGLCDGGGSYPWGFSGRPRIPVPADEKSGEVDGEEAVLPSGFDVSEDLQMQIGGMDGGRSEEDEM